MRYFCSALRRKNSREAAAPGGEARAGTCGAKLSSLSDTERGPVRRQERCGRSLLPRRLSTAPIQQCCLPPGRSGRMSSKTESGGGCHPPHVPVQVHHPNQSRNSNKLKFLLQRRHQILKAYGLRNNVAPKNTWPEANVLLKIDPPAWRALLTAGTGPALPGSAQKQERLRGNGGQGGTGALGWPKELQLNCTWQGYRV